MCILAVASLPTSAHNLAGLHTLVSSLALYITTLSSSLLLRQVRCRWLFISDVSLIKLLNCLRLNCHREDLRKLANTNCYVSFIYRVGTVHKTYRFFIFPFADAQPPRHSLSLLSSSSLPFQLINFLFRHLSRQQHRSLPIFSSHALPSHLFTLCYSHPHPTSHFHVSRFQASLKSILPLPALLISRKQADRHLPFSSSPPVLPLLFPPFPSSFFIPPFLCHILPFNLLCARGDCNVCQCTPSGALSRSHPLLFSPGAPD